MKRRNYGFTLIELLVVIVIIGILATISTATFKSYFGKARDSERTAAVQSIAMMIKVDGADVWGNTKYAYGEDDGTGVGTTDWEDPDTVELKSLDKLFKINDFRQPKGSNNICYFYGVIGGSNKRVGDDNDFVIATWGESGSTEDKKTPGLILDGTEAARAVLLTAVANGDIDKDTFACGTSDYSAIKTALESITQTDGGAATAAGSLYLELDDEAAIRPL